MPSSLEMRTCGQICDGWEGLKMPEYRLAGYLWRESCLLTDKLDNLLKIDFKNMAYLFGVHR